MGIVSTIVCVFLNIWPPGPAFLIYLLTLFYSYCSLGNIVEVAVSKKIVFSYEKLMAIFYLFLIFTLI